MELNGLFHCQFAGSDLTAFSGDQTGNIPLGLTALNPAGSCPAKPDGPVPDGVQLNTLVHDPIASGWVKHVLFHGYRTLTYDHLYRAAVSPSAPVVPIPSGI